MNSRRTAAFIVARWLATHEFPNEMLPQGGEDRGFVQDLVYTVVRRFRALRAVLGELMKTWPKGELEALVLVGAAQILYMSDVPDFAAVNETVAAAKMSGRDKRLDRVVNGVLRNLIRRREEFEAKLAAAPLAERESYPNALVKRWVARYGAENAETLAKWHNEPAETWLAYPPPVADGESGEKGESGERNGAFVKLERGKKVTEVEGFADGAFLVQDPATAGAVELLDVKPGLSVLDFCAAPGGKTAQIAWRLRAHAEARRRGDVEPAEDQAHAEARRRGDVEPAEDQAHAEARRRGDVEPAEDQAHAEARRRGEDSRLVAQEVNPKRLRRLQSNLKRLRLDWVEAVPSITSFTASHPQSPTSLRASVPPRDAVSSATKSPVPNTQSPTNLRASAPPREPDPPTAPRLRASVPPRDAVSSATKSPVPSTQHPTSLFDRVLVDAPCSNTGVLRRRPDARWRWDTEHLAQLTGLQAQILADAATHVAPGGLLVYSTCSNEPEENGDQIAAFLAAHPDFTEVARRESVPFESGHDGAFACAMRRVEKLKS